MSQCRELNLPPRFAALGKACSVRDAQVFPLSPVDLPKSLRGGVYLPSGEDQFPYVRQGRSHRGVFRSCERPYKEWAIDDKGTSERLAGKYLYLGPVYKHFGHFLAECVHRAWAWAAFGGEFDGAIVLPLRDWHSMPEQLWHSAFGHFGIPPEKIIVLQQPACCESLVVPSQVSTLGVDNPPTEYVEFLGTLQKTYETTGLPRKIYVSRSPFIATGGTLGEVFLDVFLRREGYFILRPENYPLLDQLQFYVNAEVSIFADGSALHSLELLGKLRGKAAFIFRGRRDDTIVKIGRIRFDEWYEDNSSTLLPSLYMLNPSGKENAHKAASLYDLDTLVDFLHTHGFIETKATDQWKDLYQLAVCLDFARLLSGFSYHLLEDAAGGVPASAEYFYRQLRKTVDRLKETGNPLFRSGHMGATAATNFLEECIESMGLCVFLDDSLGTASPRQPACSAPPFTQTSEGD